MWGPLTRLRRWWRPLPTVGWVFLLRWDYGRQAHLKRTLWHRPVPEGVGKYRDLCIPIPDADAALAEAKRLMAETLKPGAETVATRAADRRDIPADWCGPRIGPRRHFGFVRPGRYHWGTWP